MLKWLKNMVGLLMLYNLKERRVRVRERKSWKFFPFLVSLSKNKCIWSKATRQARIHVGALIAQFCSVFNENLSRIDRTKRSYRSFGSVRFGSWTGNLIPPKLPVFVWENNNKRNVNYSYQVQGCDKKKEEKKQNAPVSSRSNIYI